MTIEQTTTRRPGYGALWRRVPAELGFLLLTMPIAIFALSLTSSIFFTGLGTLVLVFGIFITVAGLYLARLFGSLEVLRLRWAGLPRIVEPGWENERGGFWQPILRPFVNGHYWLSLLHTLIVSPIVSVASWSITITWVSGALGGTTYWFWGRWIDNGEEEFWVHRSLVGDPFGDDPSWIDPYVAESLFHLTIGLIFLSTLPFVARGLTMLHWAVARGMLSAWRSEELSAEVTQLAASRGAAIQAEDHALRRLERDIHDGPQQRLVRLQMDLARAERMTDTDPEGARLIVEEARGQAAAALEELRALSRGFAPPILQDRGLAAGLESLAARSPIPVQSTIVLGDVTLAPEIERNAYFVVAELLVNAAKHSQALSIRLDVRTETTGPGSTLVVTVADTGAGGATMPAEHGLRGIDERLRGLGGSLQLSSPVGVGTTAIAVIPL